MLTLLKDPEEDDPIEKDDDDSISGKVLLFTVTSFTPSDACDVIELPLVDGRCECD